MSAGTLSPPANGQATKAEAPLWGELDIPLIVGTGEFGQGKSLAGLTICPGPQTLCYDFEGGVLSYRSLDFDHVDMATELLKKHPSGGICGGERMPSPEVARADAPAGIAF
jgi:hypothetical protein